MYHFHVHHIFSMLNMSTYLSQFLLALAFTSISDSLPNDPPMSAHSMLKDCLAAKAVPTVLNSSPNWTTLAAPYNLRLQPTPLAITIPNTPKQVSDAVTCAAAAGFKVQARSGGHSYGSYSLGGKNGSLVVDLQNFNSIFLDNCKSCFVFRSLVFC